MRKYSLSKTKLVTRTISIASGTLPSYHRSSIRSVCRGRTGKRSSSIAIYNKIIPIIASRAFIIMIPKGLTH